MKIKKMTMQEFSNTFNCYVAMDADREVYIYKRKPYKNENARHWEVQESSGDEYSLWMNITLLIKRKEIIRQDWQILVEPESKKEE